MLIAFLVMAVLGSHWGTLWDPLVLLYRSTAAGLLPGAQWAVEESTTPLAQSDNRAAQAVSKYAAEPAYTFLRDNVFGGVDRQRQAFWGGGLILALFFGLLLLNRYRPRFWCRYLCPLGGLLGLLAWRPLLRRAVQPESCNRCDLCAQGLPRGRGGRARRPVETVGMLRLPRLYRSVPPREPRLHLDLALGGSRPCSRWTSRSGPCWDRPSAGWRR